MFQGEPWGGEVEEDCVGFGGGGGVGLGISGEEESVCVDVAVVDFDDVLEAVLLHFVVDAAGSLLVELKTADFAKSPLSFVGWGLCCCPFFRSRC